MLQWHRLIGIVLVFLVFNGLSGRVEFVLLPPETYGTPTAPGTKPVPSAGDAIDPALPAQFTSADIDPRRFALPK